MYEMALAIEHDIPVVPVLDLEKVSDYAVRSHAAYEIRSGLQNNRCMNRCLRLGKSRPGTQVNHTHCLKLCRQFVSIHLSKVLVHTDVCLSSDLISRL